MAYVIKLVDRIKLVDQLQWSEIIIEVLIKYIFVHLPFLSLSDGFWHNWRLIIDTSELFSPNKEIDKISLSGYYSTWPNLQGLFMLPIELNSQWG